MVGVVVAPGGPTLKRMLFPAHMKLRREVKPVLHITSQIDRPWMDREISVYRIAYP